MMRKVGTTKNGNIIVEMSPVAWASLCDTTMPTLGQRIKAYREEHYLSQEALARQVGMTRACVSLIENDKANYTKATYLKLVRVIGKATEAVREGA